VVYSENMLRRKFIPMNAYIKNKYLMKHLMDLEKQQHNNPKPIKERSNKDQSQNK
jgi:hypothetical protein